MGVQKGRKESTHKRNWAVIKVAKLSKYSLLSTYSNIYNYKNYSKTINIMENFKYFTKKSFKIFKKKYITHCSYILYNDYDYFMLRRYKIFWTAPSDTGFLSRVHKKVASVFAVLKRWNNIFLD